MHDAQLDPRFRIDRVDGIRKAFQTIYTGDQDIIQAAVFQLSQDVQPELCTFVFCELHAQQFFMAFDVYAQRQEHRLIDDAAILTYLQVQYSPDKQ
ncbi:hypothetical protein BBW68_09695 [Candidatus Erwinia dacicola]|uniref:Uncharacterized protein n=1 Tax=Candidatus Erwinia dacicola TaxID=252393 RepID=A0A1E7Z1I2_9GAMM|nr:hypothetical protein BBW68_09695 [Candidatus Erwinia dacicola]